MQRELTRARNVYLGSLRRLNEAMEEFNSVNVEHVPVDGGRIAPWSGRDTQTMRACASVRPPMGCKP